MSEYVFILVSCFPVLDYHYLTPLESFRINRSKKNHRDIDTPISHGYLTSKILDEVPCQ